MYIMFLLVATFQVHCACIHTHAGHRYTHGHRHTVFLYLNFESLVSRALYACHQAKPPPLSSKSQLSRENPGNKVAYVRSLFPWSFALTGKVIWNWTEVLGGQSVKQFNEFPEVGTSDYGPMVLLCTWAKDIPPSLIPFLLEITGGLKLDKLRFSHK